MSLTVFICTPTWQIATVDRALVTWVKTDHPHTETNHFLNKRTSKGLVVLNKHYLIVNIIFCHSNLAMMKYHESKHLHLISCNQLINSIHLGGKIGFIYGSNSTCGGRTWKGRTQRWAKRSVAIYNTEALSLSYLPHVACGICSRLSLVQLLGCACI